MNKNEVIEQARRFYAVELEKQEIVKREREKEKIQYYKELADRFSDIFQEVKIIIAKGKYYLYIYGYLFKSVSLRNSNEIIFLGKSEISIRLSLDKAHSLTNFGKVLHENPIPELVVYVFDEKEYYFSAEDSMFYAVKGESEKTAKEQYIKRMAENIEFSFPQTSTVSLKDAACGQVPQETGQPEEFVGRGDFKVVVGDSQKHGLYYYNEFCDDGAESAKEKE